MNQDEYGEIINGEETKIEQAISNIQRGTDIESSALILEKCVLDNYIITGGRVNMLHLAVKQILYFIENSKIQNVGDKSILDYVKENVKLKERVNQLESREQKLIEKLEEDIKMFGNYEERKQMAKEQLYENDGRWFYAQEILSILKEN